MSEAATLLNQRGFEGAAISELMKATRLEKGGTAIDADDGNPVLRERARKALREWRDLLSLIISTGVERKEIRRGVDAKSWRLISDLLWMQALRLQFEPQLIGHLFLDFD